MANFGIANVKQEGTAVPWDMSSMGKAVYEKTLAAQTTYVERRVPIELEDEAHALIDAWLVSKGFDPEAM